MPLPHDAVEVAAQGAGALMVDNLARGFTAAPEPEKGAEEGESTVIILQPPPSPTDAASGALKIEVGDGSVVIDFNPKSNTVRSADAEDHDANLAEHMSASDLGAIAGVLLPAIEADDTSRQEWLQTRAEGIELLGFKLDEPKADAGSAASSMEGVSTVRHPLLTEAVIRFQSNASAELLPAGGPVKVRDDAPETPPGMGHNGGPTLGGPDPDGAFDGDDLAEALEKDFNHYLTATDKGYRPDTDRMLFWVGFGGAGFKKVYNCPIRRMPISRSVDAADLIVANAANDFEDSGRVTHRILMRRSTLVRMQIAKVYRRLDGMITAQPTQQPNAVDETIAEIQGFNSRMQRPEDALFTIYECYTELNLKGFEHVGEDGQQTGLELPYRVTMDKDSRQILEIRRNWRKDDQNCLPKRVFVKFPFIPALGFYDIGLLHLLGNADRALTAAWRLMLDTGMFANFPGFLYADQGGRQMTNEFRVAPGTGTKIQTGSQPIQNVVMPLPYKDVGAGLAQLVTNIETTGQRVGGTAELQVGEGRQDAPVGTTLALIEQATKMLAAVHIRLHAAQSEEFQLLKERFKEDPEAFWRHNPRTARPWEIDLFLTALQRCDIVPAADPNTSSHMQRIMKAVAVKQLQAANPTLYDGKAVDSMIFKMINIANYEKLFAPPPPPGAAPPGPPPDPAKMAAVQQKAAQAAQKAQTDEQARQDDAATAARAEDARLQEIAVESSDRAADRESRERVADTRKEIEQIKANSEVEKTHIGAQSDIATTAMAGAHDQNVARITGAHDLASQQIEGKQNLAKAAVEGAHTLAGQARDHAHQRQQQQVAQAHEAEGGRIEAAVDLHKHAVDTRAAHEQHAIDAAMEHQHHATETALEHDHHQTETEIERAKIAAKPKAEK